MNITDTIEPKVDQLTADHLIGRTLTIRITAVHLAASEQPCEIHYEGENGLPYRPGKSMRRVLVHAWGGDVNKYVGRAMRLYRDDDVQFGGLKVGGVRISHMSHITGALTMALTAKKGSKKAFKVLPLVEEKTAPATPSPPAPATPSPPDKAAQAATALVERVKAAPDMAALELITADETVVRQRAWLAGKRPELARIVEGAVIDALSVLEKPGDEGFPDDGWPGPTGTEDAAA